MKLSTKLLAVARIRQFTQKPNTYRCTAKGDLLFESGLPAKAQLLLPARPGDWPSTQGIDSSSGTYEDTTLLEVRQKGNFTEVTLAFPGGTVRTFEELKGRWICMEIKTGADEAEPQYVYEIKGRTISSPKNKNQKGTITDYFDTGANGVFVVSLENGKEIMIPFLPERMTYPDHDTCLFDGFEDFLDAVQ